MKTHRLPARLPFVVIAGLYAFVLVGLWAGTVAADPGRAMRIRRAPPSWLPF